MRLIDADALKEKLCYEDYGCPADGEEVTYRYVMEYDIDNTPTIDAEPVRCGRWLKRDVHRVRNKNQPVFILQCSECALYTTIKSTYCPTCGARMR